MKPQTIAPTASADHLLQAARYLSRPQQFLAVGEARAGLRKALEDASQGCIVLTNNGQPQAAIVAFQTLETMRSALLQLLLGGMEESFEKLRKETAAQPAQPGSDRKTSESDPEQELESLIKAARRQQARRDSAKRHRKSD